MFSVRGFNPKVKQIHDLIHRHKIHPIFHIGVGDRLKSKRIVRIYKTRYDVTIKCSNRKYDI